MKVSDQLHTPATLLPGAEPTLPTGEEAGWVLELVWMLKRRRSRRRTKRRRRSRRREEEKEETKKKKKKMMTEEEEEEKLFFASARHGTMICQLFIDVYTLNTLCKSMYVTIR
jgi:hypothetical protein